MTTDIDDTGDSNTDTISITLTEDQQEAYDKFFTFLGDPIETVFVLSGYAGCGKSTLVKSLLDNLKKYTETLKLINPKFRPLTVQLTATTNKAAENFANIAKCEVRTIHSFLGLRVNTDFKTGVTRLTPNNRDILQDSYLIFIDEASYVDSQLLKLIFAGTSNCKYVFIGDPAQLTPVKATGTPVFDAKFTGAELTTVVRQAEDSPIIALSTTLRNWVNTGTLTQFTPDGKHIHHLSKDEFTEVINKEFSRSDWKYQDSKVLAWTNRCVIGYNQYIRNHIKGDPHFEVGDYAICNSFINSCTPIKTDQLVMISAIEPDCYVHGVKGNYFLIDGISKLFMPKSLKEKNTRLKEAQANDEYHIAREIELAWIDLRAAYACTVNKSQGSTYDTVFIDLDDIAKCTSQNQVARMLYVAVSRARHNVYLTGDLV